jgi:hypothetical protein
MALDMLTLQFPSKASEKTQSFVRFNSFSAVCVPNFRAGKSSWAGWIGKLQ